jgi:limonene-1,2-epoxide hydrolase
MINLSIADNENEQLALALLKAMEDGTLGDQLKELCTDDFVWANSGLPTLSGLMEIFEHMASGGFAQQIPILASMASFSADIVHIASAGDVVFSERIDHHWDAQGRDLMTPHIAGVMEIRDGKIAALRDFYDTVCYQQEPTEANPAHAIS